MHPAWTMEMKTNADMHPMTIHNFVADNSIPLLEFSPNGIVLETAKIITLLYNIIVLSPVELVVIWSETMRYFMDHDVYG